MKWLRAWVRRRLLSRARQHLQGCLRCQVAVFFGTAPHGMCKVGGFRYKAFVAWHDPDCPDCMVRGVPHGPAAPEARAN